MTSSAHTFHSADRVTIKSAHAFNKPRAGTIMRIALQWNGGEPVAYVLPDDASIYTDAERFLFSELEPLDAPATPYLVEAWSRNPRTEPIPTPCLACGVSHGPNACGLPPLPAYRTGGA